MADKTKTKVPAASPEAPASAATPVAPSENSASTPASTTPQAPGEMMSISKADFDKLIGTINRQSKDIQTLYDVADKGRLARATSNANGESLIKTVKVSKWPDNNRFILGWKLTTNVSEIVNGRWIEKQDTLLVFDDGTTLEVPLLDFYRKAVKEKAEIVKRNKEEKEGKEVTLLTVRFHDGRTIIIDAVYIN